MSTQNVNVARFARNVEWGFFCDFQTPCKGRDIGSETEDFPITYNNVVLNYGNGLDAESGTFTVPLSGYYSFHFDGGQTYYRFDEVYDQSNIVYVFKNSELMLEMSDSGPYPYVNTIRYQHLHFSFEEKLKEGDTINLKLKQDDWLYANSLHRISFKGELLYVEDIE